jgi:hypothetical protein
MDKICVMYVIRLKQLILNSFSQVTSRSLLVHKVKIKILLLNSLSYSSKIIQDIQLVANKIKRMRVVMQLLMEVSNINSNLKLSINLSNSSKVIFIKLNWPHPINTMPRLLLLFRPVVGKE